MKFTNWLNANWEKDNMFPPMLDAQKAVNFLQQYLLGEEWYIVNPLSTGQANCEIVHDILYKYSRKYRKEVKKKNRRVKTMTEEEKKAIVYLKNYSVWNQAQGFSRGKNDEAIEIVLNLIQKQQEELDMYKDIKRIAETQVTELADFIDYKGKLEKKDKIIANQKEALKQANKKILTQKGQLKALNQIIKKKEEEIV